MTHHRHMPPPPTPRDFQCCIELATLLQQEGLTPQQVSQAAVTLLSTAAGGAAVDSGVYVALADGCAGAAKPAEGWAWQCAIGLADQPIGCIAGPRGGAVLHRSLREGVASLLASWWDRCVTATKNQRELVHQRDVLRVAGVGSWWGDPVHDRLELSEVACDMFEVSQGAVLRYTELLSLIVPSDRQRVHQLWREALQGVAPAPMGPGYGVSPPGASRCEFDFRVISATECEGERWLLLTAELMRRTDGRVFGVIGTLRDITRIKRAEERMRLSTRIFDSVGEAIIVTDVRGNIVEVNPAFSRLSGYSREEVLQRNPRFLKSGQQGKAFYERMWQALHRDNWFQSEFWNRAKDGSVYPQLQTLTTIRDAAGQVTHYVGIGTDLTQLRLAQERTQYLDSHDPLTDLLNRHTVMERLRHRLQAHSPESAPAPLACPQAELWVVGVDGFKSVNDSMGHAAGDALLVEMARRLRSWGHQGVDIGRLGGDEFIVVLHGLSPEAPEEGPSQAQALLGWLAQPVVLEGHEFMVTVSVGISRYPQDGTAAEVLLKNAESALHSAKRRGRNTLAVYEPQMNQTSLSRLMLLSSLRRAIPAGELQAWYQPKLDLHSHRLVGVEALVRWKHPEQGWIPPGRFIPEIEDSDLITALGEWMLREVVTQSAAWQASGHGWLPVAVNLGARHFAQPSLPGLIASLRHQYGIPEGVLELELTESTLMRLDAEPDRWLAALRAAGVALSIDDFGTGYSSLSYLKHLPVDALKIDRSFVSNIERDARDLSIGATIIALAHGLGLKVIAEGVETEGQRALLECHGCDQGQGFLFARPMPVAEFEIWRTVWESQTV